MAEIYDLSPADVAHQLGVHKDTVVLWADKGQLPCWRTPNGHRRFRQSDVDALIAMGRS